VELNLPRNTSRSTLQQESVVWLLPGHGVEV
jgi:hypothetical protein